MSLAEGFAQAFELHAFDVLDDLESRAGKEESKTNRHEVNTSFQNSRITSVFEIKVFKKFWS